MKKLLIALFSVCLVCGIAITCACNCNNTSDKKLTYGKKYYSSVSIGNDATDSYYYLFNKDGTGTYSSCYSYAVTEGTNNTQKSGYVIEFNYQIVDDRVICTFNSEVASFDGRHCSSNWYNVFEFDEDFLFIQGQYGESVYFCEDYLKTVPNFGK